MNSKILDISYCQSQPIDWAGLAARNVGVIARAGQANFEDNLFDRHYAGATAAGVPFGMYWFYQPNMAPDQQVYTFLSIYKALANKPKVIMLDVENITYPGVNIVPPSIDTHTAWLRKWLADVEAATGVIPGIYTRANYWDAWVRRSSAWGRYPLWIAAWTVYTSSVILPKDWSNWAIWQYEGGTGRDEDVTGPVDQNRYNGDDNAMRKFFGLPPLPTGPTDKEKLDILWADYLAKK
jgi:lysozyme